MSNLSKSTLVAGVDSSTQSCKVVIRELATGAVVRTGSAKHPDGSEVDPEAWWVALNQAIESAGGLADVSSISIAAQQHGMVALDAEGKVIRKALLWNDTRSASSALDLIKEVGATKFADLTGSVPVASFTITKLRWLRDNEPENAARVAAVALPHDWLTWRLRGFGPIGQSKLGPDLTELATDRSDASGTGYFNSATNQYEWELIELALGHRPHLPQVLGPRETVGHTPQGLVVGVGAGDNAGAALGLGCSQGDVVISLGTSGTVFGVATTPSQDLSGTIAGFADASGHFLPIGVTLNAARVLKTTADLLGVDFDDFADLALSAQPGSDGVVMVPYFEGERTPNLPNAKAGIHGLTLASNTRSNLARASIEGMLSGLAYGLDALIEGGAEANRLLLIGGAAQSKAVQEIAATIFDLPIQVPEISEYVAEGAAVQAAWALTGNRPNWPTMFAAEYQPARVDSISANYKRYAQLYV